MLNSIVYKSNSSDIPLTTLASWISLPSHQQLCKLIELPCLPLISQFQFASMVNLLEGDIYKGLSLCICPLGAPPHLIHVLLVVSLHLSLHYPNHLICLKLKLHFSSVSQAYHWGDFIVSSSPFPFHFLHSQVHKHHAYFSNCQSHSSSVATPLEHIWKMMRHQR